MHPINLVLDTPARPLPDRPSTAGLGEVGPPVRIGPGPDFGGVQLRFRLKGRCCPARLGELECPRRVSRLEHVAEHRRPRFSDVFPLTL